MVAIEVRLVNFASSGLRGACLGCGALGAPLDSDRPESAVALPLFAAGGATELDTMGLVSVGVRLSA
jgi:hypothetical protein